jgi:hypothetical protein
MNRFDGMRAKDQILAASSRRPKHVGEKVAAVGDGGIAVFEMLANVDTALKGVEMTSTQ